MNKTDKVVIAERLNELIDFIVLKFGEYTSTEDLNGAVMGIVGDKLNLKIVREDTYEKLMQGYNGGNVKYKDSATFYLVGTTEITSGTGDSQNVYDEYIYLGDEAPSDKPYEKIGEVTTAISLDEYVKYDDLQEMSAEELSQKWQQAFSG